MGSGGNGSRRKGRRAENELAAYLTAQGYPASRISEAGLPGPDLQAFNGRTVEVKRYAQPLSKVVARYLQDTNMVIERWDRGDWVVHIPLDEMLDIIDEAHESAIQLLRDTLGGNSDHRIARLDELGARGGDAANTAEIGTGVEGQGRGGEGSSDSADSSRRPRVWGLVGEPLEALSGGGGEDQVAENVAGVE